MKSFGVLAMTFFITFIVQNATDKLASTLKLLVATDALDNILKFCQQFWTLQTQD